MSSDLRKIIDSDELRKGMSIDEAISLLGPPEKQYDNKLSYFLGYEEGLGVDTESLIIEEDVGLVKDFYVQRS